MEANIITPIKITKSTNTYPNSDFTFGIDKNGNQILVAKPVSAIYYPDRLSIIVAIDEDYSGTPEIYYFKEKGTIYVSFKFTHSSVPNRLYEWTINIDNNLFGANKPKTVYLTDTKSSLDDTMIEGQGTETSEGTEVSFDEPPMK
ncbi:hypothetical protein [Tenacibaculum jejuense]|uniref:Uncharacterized protein n=1 Tax=Tenacibaculum jejuense TaxID=584609 RepID=A0A238UDX1_9FLAO|nr:hypothetical protein [Tenacibaculum jejuense]SNR17282.1 Protein of unknown function [Tenacibaculum jejuense]